MTTSLDKHAAEPLGLGLQELLEQLDRSNVGYWNWDVAANQLYLSSSCRRLFGVSEEEPMSYERFLAAVHGDDRQHVHEAIRTKLESKVGTEYTIEHRIVWPDGTERWIQVKGSVTVADAISVRMAGIAIDITQRKQSDALISYEQARLQAVLEQLPHGVMFADAPSGRLVLVNDRVEKIIGHHFIASEGLEQYDAFIGYHPDGLRYAAHEWPLARSIRNGEVVTREEIRYERPDGSHVYIEVSSTPIRDANGRICGGVAIFADMTERKLADEALRERENRLALALAAGQMGTWDVDLQSGHSTWDARYLKLLDYADYIVPSEAAFLKRVHPDDRIRVQSVARLDREASDLEHEFRIVRSDGEVRWLVSKGVLLKDDDGHAKRIVGISYDITEQKRNEERLRSFAQQLEVRVEERTQELVTSQMRLRALASELNLAEQRERKRLAAELHDHLQQLLVLGKLKLGQGKRLASMPSCMEVMEQVDHLLTETLTYTRTLVAELSPPVLYDHGLAPALKWLGEYMKTKYDMAVTVTVPPEDERNLPEEHAVLMLQSVRELLINSRKHAGTNQAAVTMLKEGATLRIEVRDQGKGFEMAEVETPAELSSKFGLFSIRERMRVIGGVLEIESGVGLGTRAVLELPISAAPQGTSLVRQGDKGESRSGPSPQKSSIVTVLLVDDHSMMRQGLRSVLEGYQDVAVIAEAANGEEAINLAERLRPRIVIMDINMPTMNGVDATQYITSHFPDMAVIGLSVNADGKNREAMKRAGAGLLLTKEAAVEELYRAIQHVVRSTGQHSHMRPAH